MNLKQSICKHKSYRIIQCEKGRNLYICQCEKCNLQFDKPKAKDEMYTIGMIINT